MRRHLRPVFITGLFLLAGFFGAGCGESEPQDMYVQKVDERTFLIYDNEGYNPEVGIPQTCAANGMTVKASQKAPEESDDVMVVVCNDPEPTATPTPDPLFTPTPDPEEEFVP
jgi:hypothetical protein